MAPHAQTAAQVALILNNQKIAAQNAFRRRGEKPRDLPSREISIHEYDVASLNTKMGALQGGRQLLTATVIGEPYHPSVAALKDLQNILIKDLKLEVNHRGSYLTLRLIRPAMRMSAVMNVAEDEAGTAIPFALYFQDPETARPAENILKENEVVIVKEPYFKVGAHGQYVVRVDQPTDLVRLSEDDPRVPAKWRTATAGVSRPAEHWKKIGNDFVTGGKYLDAIEMYSRGLRSSPTIEEQEILLNNRALAYIRIEAFDLALKDTCFINNIKDRSEKALYRGVLALYNLQRFMEALELLRVLTEKFPDSAGAKYELARTRARLVEQNKGKYNFKTLYKAAELRPPRMDSASFRGPVEIRESKVHGRGLFTTKSVKAGDLLLCEKAFSHCFATPVGETIKAPSKFMATSSVLIDVPNNSTRMGTHADVIRDVCNKLALNPSLAPPLEALYHGDYQGVSTSSVDGKTVVDTFMIAKIINYNAFGSPLTSRHSLSDPELARASGIETIEEDKHAGTCGIWILPSYINHSCDNNCQRSFIGDLQIVRAARNMAPGTELTFLYTPREDPEDVNEKLLKGWEFECTCTICATFRETPPVMITKRTRLLKSFYALGFKSIKKKLEIIKELEGTYPRPLSEVPRMEMWPVHFSLVTHYAQKPDIDNLIKHIQAAFSSVGFVISGVNIGSKKITVKKWGIPYEGTMTAWLTLRNLYKLLGHIELADQAKELARVSWMLLVGEDETFVYENPPQ